jgi:hypothetical protein
MHPAIRRFVIVVGMLSSAYAQSGGIQGTVTSLPAGGGSPASGAVISGAHVYFRRVPVYAPAKVGTRPQLAPGEVQFDISTSSDGNGKHKASGVPQGDYVACASVPGQPYLNPCQWSVSPVVHVQNGIVSDLDIKLERGVFLDVRVNDPQKLLPTSSNTLFDSPRLVVGVVFGNGAFLSVPLKSTDSAGRTYELAVPSGIPLRLWLFSQHVTLSDSRGKTLTSPSAAILFTAASGIDQTFTVNVTGRLQ